jgi:hypothetical protein
MENNPLLFGMINGVGGSRATTPDRLRDEFIAHVEQNSAAIPPDVADDLKSRKTRLSDAAIYSTKPVTGTTVKIFVPKDDKTVGLSNLDKGKLEDGQMFALNGIRVLAGTDGVGDGNPADVVFHEIDADPRFANLANGEFKIVANRKVIAEKMPLTLCCTAGKDTAEKGVYYFDNRRFVEPGKEIEVTLELGSTSLLPNNAFVRVELLGIVTLPN